MTEIMSKINRMPRKQRMFIAKRIIHSVLAEDQNKRFKKAVDCLYDDYRAEERLIKCLGRITKDEILQVQEGITKVIGYR